MLVLTPDDANPTSSQRAQLQPLPQDQGAQVRALRALQGRHHPSRRSQEEK